MHLTDVQIEILSNPQELKQLKSKRKLNQPWILWNDEANSVGTHFDQLNFNWTQSYKIESEASYGAYGYYARLGEDMSDEAFLKRVNNNFEKRKSNSLWFVSNCGSKIRNKFAVDLSMNSNVYFHELLIFLACYHNIK